ncbi:hypothetical protein MauCBS54593_004979 [Microsporum audouinii]
MSEGKLYSQGASYFSLPLPLWQQPVSYRTAKYEQLKQRGRFRRVHDGNSNKEQDEESSNDNETESAIESEPGKKDKHRKKHGSKPRPPLILSPGEAHQYRISGLPNYRELPGGGFPHKAGLEDLHSTDSDDESEDNDYGDNTTAPASKRRNKNRIINSRQRIEEDLSQLNPPLYLAGGNPTKKNTLRLRHLSVVTTILHRCLMEGDYVRAGRALGLILRDNFGGHPADVRSSGRWATGAEILLWNGSGGSEPEDVTEGLGKMGKSSGWFTRAGFERAREYYERLIIQYQYRKMAPNALSPLHFYPAMFGLWISVAQEESRLARKNAELADSLDVSVTGSGGCYDPNLGMQDDLEGQKLTTGNSELITAARTKELEDARQIAVQMDELLVSPPFSDSHELLRLRGMVSQWIGDLYVSSVVPTNNGSGLPDADEEYGDGLSVDDYGNARLDAKILRMEINSAKEKRATEAEKAQSFFDKAQARLDRTRTFNT